MKRWRLLMIVVVIGALCAASVHHLLKAEEKRRREATYQSELLTYSKNLKRGLTRGEVEDYFRSKSVQFGQACCSGDGHAYYELVRIGEEDSSWYCSESVVFIEFDFAATEPREAW